MSTHLESREGILLSEILSETRTDSTRCPPKDATMYLTKKLLKYSYCMQQNLLHI